MESLETVIKKIDEAAYNVQLLELLSVWRALDAETTHLFSDNNYVEQLKKEKSKEFMEGYSEACTNWVNGISEELEIIKERIIQLMGAEEIYKKHHMDFIHLFEDYKYREIDVEEFFSTFKRIVKEVYVPALKN